MIESGDLVSFETMPSWVAELPEESRRVFHACLGKPFRVEEIDEDGQCVLDVSELIDPMFGGFNNDLRLEPEFLTKA